MGDYGLWRADYELLTEGYRIRAESRKDLVELRYLYGRPCSGKH